MKDSFKKDMQYDVQHKKFFNIDANIVYLWNKAEINFIP
jgi:hypothetical protein